jgi:hypothetical protein
MRQHFIIIAVNRNCELAILFALLGPLNLAGFSAAYGHDLDSWDPIEQSMNMSLALKEFG